MDKIQINGSSLDKGYKITVESSEDKNKRSFIVFTEDKDFVEQKISKLADIVPLLEPTPLNILNIEEVEILHK